MNLSIKQLKSPIFLGDVKDQNGAKRRVNILNNAYIGEVARNTTPH